MASDITMYTVSGCPYCVRAERLLRDRGIAFTEVNLDRERNFRRVVMEATGGYTVPQIVIDGTPIGGSDELAALDRKGKLVELIAG